MKTKMTKLGAVLLAALMLAGSFASCAQPDNGGATGGSETNKSDSPAGTSAGNQDENPDGESNAGTSGNDAPADSDGDGNTADGTEPGENTPDVSETEDNDKLTTDALAALGEIDYGKRELGIIYSHENEIVGKNETVDADGGTAQVINDAVYQRNVLLEERCNLVFAPIEVADVTGKVRTEATAPTGDFVFIDSPLGTTATSFTVGGFLSDWNELGINLTGPWWDSGTADFVIHDGVYFMSGSLNFVDDQLTYVLLFNKEMQRTYANTVPNPYDTVRAGEWTLDHFNTVIQGVSSESSGNGQWDELDTYGFVTTWEYGNTMFLGCDLRYVINDETVDEPTLFLAEQSRMDKAMQVLDLVQAIYHDNNATFMSPPGKENLGLAAFKENRGLFYAEVVSYIATLNAEMKGDYGVLPVPKYNKEQEFYRTWTHDSGTTFSIISSVPEADREVIGQIMSAYAILSHQYIKPAFYDTVLTSRNMRDADSAEMMDLIFANRVYDMAFYFRDLGFYELFKTCVNDNEDSFSSAYTSKTKSFSKKTERLFGKLAD